MSRVAPPPKPRVPPPTPVVIPATLTSMQAAMLEILSSLGPGASAALGKDSTTIIFEFASATVQGYRCPRDGHIGLVKAGHTAAYVTVNVDPPSAGSINGGATKIWLGLVYGDAVGTMLNGFPCWAKFKGPDPAISYAGDVIWCRAALGDVVLLTLYFD